MFEHPQSFSPSPPSLASLRERLVQARYQRDWSQQELADLLGTTPLNISRWERGLTTPNPYFRHKLCTVFGLSEIELGLRQDPALMLLPREADKEAIPSRFPLYDPFLPLPATVLLGRADLLAQLKSQLATKRTIALSALHGLPGVGKTALALELAYDPELRERYPDGLLWAALGPQSNLLGLLSRWGTLLGIHEDEAARLNTPEAWARTLRATIGARRLLFVLDDAWSLEDALACQVGGPQCGYILTMRLPQLAQSFGPGEVCTVGTLDEDTSLELLRHLAPWAVEQAREQLQPLVRAVGGLPLALSLMGHSLRQQTHDRQPRRLQNALKRLENRLIRLQLARPQAPGEGSQRNAAETKGMLSLEVVIKISAQQLPASARQGWAALSVLPARPHSFSEAAALAVSGTSLETLDALSDAGVLEAVGPTRYTFHQVLADYGRAQLSQQEEQIARRRLIDYGLLYAEEHRDSPANLEQEASMLTAALEACEEQAEQEALLRLTLALATSWKVRGDYVQAERWLPRAGENAHALGLRREEARVYLLQGEIAMEYADYEQVLIRCEQGLALARQVGEVEEVCASLSGIGWVAYKRGQYEQAEQVLSEGLALARQQSLVRQQAGLLRVLGSVMDQQGKIEEEQAYLQEGLQLAQQVDDHDLTCIMFNNLGVLNHALGNFAQAAGYYRDGLTLARQGGYRYMEGLLLSNLGGITCLQGDYEQGEQYLREGLHAARQCGNPEYICAALTNLGDVALSQGNYEQAEQYLQEGLQLARQLGVPKYVCIALMNLGKVAQAPGEYEQAEQYLQEGLQLARRLGTPEYMCTMLVELGKVALARGDYEQAEQYLQEALSLARRVGLSVYTGQALNILGKVALARGDYEQAEQYLQEALSLARQYKAPEDVTIMLTNLGALACVRGKYEQGEQYLQEGLQLARQLSLRPLLCRTLCQWGELALQRKQLEVAATTFEEILVTVPKGTRLESAQAQYGLARVAAAEGKKAVARQSGNAALTTLEAIGHGEAAQVRHWLERLEHEVSEISDLGLI